jgi:hypothetical protein
MTTDIRDSDETVALVEVFYNHQGGKIELSQFGLNVTETINALKEEITTTDSPKEICKEGVLTIKVISVVSKNLITESFESGKDWTEFILTLINTYRKVLDKLCQETIDLYTEGEKQ